MKRHGFVFLTIAACAGCMIVTGSTDGYQLADIEGGAPVDGLSLGCISSADCVGEAGAQVCCLVLTSSTSAVAACQAAPCTSAFGAQLCKTTAECRGTTPCVSQQCTPAGVSVAVSACGVIPSCTAP